MAICKCSPEYSYVPHTDSRHELQEPNRCLVPNCECQGFEDRGSTWNDTFVSKTHQNEF